MLGSLCGPTCGFPLFLHVFGAMLLVGGVATVTLLSGASLSRAPVQAAFLRRLAFATSLIVVVPSFIAMRGGAQWVLSKYPGLEDNSPTWLGIGFVVSDVGVLIIAAITILAWVAYRRTRPDAGRPVTAPILTGLAGLYLVALAAAWFAMSGKPGS